MKNLVIIFLSVLFLASCNSVTEGYQVQGKLDGLNNQEVILEFLSFTTNEAIDTTTTDEEGNFELKGTANESGYYRLVSGQKFWIFMLKNPGNVTINADANDPLLKTIEISGDESAVKFQETIEFITAKQDGVSGMVQQYQALQQQMQQPGMAQEQLMAAQIQMSQIQQQLEAKDVEIKAELKSHINSVEDPLIGIYLLSSLNVAQELDFIKEKMAVYSEQMPNSSYVSGFQERITQTEQGLAQQKAQEEAAAKAGKKVQIGSPAPDIVMKNTQGVDMKLSDLKGKVVLVDFWASWCKPCRIENPNVVATYNKYKNQGFTVFSVSLDKARDPWLKAIEKDGLVWNTHVSDLQFWNNAAAKLYGVQSIPAAFLIDKDGNIVARDLRGAALGKKVKEIIG